MDDDTRFERQLAEELDDMAGPGRGVDAMAMTRAASARPRGPAFRSIFSATRVVVVGAIAAVVATVLVIGGTPRPDQDLTPAAASASPSAPATVLSGLVTEVVEPGVLRIIRDDAGHDLDEGHPDWRYDLDDLVIGSDGSIWLATTLHGTDNRATTDDRSIWSLGRPGKVTIPQGVGDPVPLADGAILFVGDSPVRFDGSSFRPDGGPPAWPVLGGTLWVLKPGDLTGLGMDDVAGESPGDRVAVIWDGGSWIRLGEWGRVASSNGRKCQATDDGVACVDLVRSGRRFLRGTLINGVAAAPDGSIWAIAGQEETGDGGGLFRIAPP
ncbi:MAG: hypothetical protein ABWZ82_10880 [Candidatus Limnocylindrales bacterium]